MRILFVRHGESTGNLTNCFYDSPHVELTEKGREQALETGKRLAELLREDECDAVYCSTWLRAMQTCIVAIEAAKTIRKVVTFDERLKERSVGSLAGKRLDDFGEDCHDNLISRDIYAGIWTYDSPRSKEFGVETLPELRRRVRSFLDETYMKHSNSTIVVFSHGGLGRMFQAICGGWPEDGRFDKIEFLQNGEIIELFFNG